MKSQKLIVISLGAFALAVFAACMLVSWASEGRGPAAEALPAQSDAAAAVEASYPAPSGPKGGRASTPVRSLHESGELGALRIHLSFEGGASAAGLQVKIKNPWWTNRPACVQPGTTDSDGMVVFRDLEAGQKQIEVDRAIVVEGAIVNVVVGKTTAVALTLPVALTLEGRVVDWEGNPVGSAAVWMGGPFAGGYDAREVCRVDALGRFQLVSSINPCVVWARAKGHAPSNMELVHAPRGAERAVKLVLPGPGECVTGVVRGVRGEPLAGATVRVGGGRLDKLMVTSLRGGGDVPCAQVETDEAGEFQIEGVPEGEHEVSARMPGLAPWSGSCRVHAGRTTELAIQLSEAVWVSGVVRNAGGDVVAGARVHAGAPGSLGERRALSGEGGEYELTGLAAGRVVIMCEHPEHGEAETEVDCAAGGGTNGDLVLSLGRQLTGYIVTADGQAMEGVAVRVWTELQPGEKSPMRLAVADQSGRFAVSNLGEGPCGLKAQGPAIKERVVRGVIPESGEVTVVVEESAAPTAVVHGFVRHEGAPGGVRGAMVLILARGATVPADSTFVDDGSGDFLLRGVRPGWYKLAVESRGYPRWLSEWRYVGEYDDWNLGEVKLGRTGSLRLDIAREGSAVGGVSAVVCDGDGEVRGYIEPVDLGGSGQVRLFPGEYRVTVRGTGVAAALKEAVVEAGEESRLTVQSEAGVRQRILLVNRGDPVDVSESVRLTVANDGERVVEDTWGYERIASDYWLAPGLYVVRIEVGKRAQETHFEVGHAAGLPVRVVLP